MPIDETKICSRCEKELPISEFSSSGEKYQNNCKKCAGEYYLEYTRSFEGIISRMYGAMKHRTKAGQVPKGLLGQIIFNDFCNKNLMLKVIIKNWAKLGYQEKHSPSIDRIDPAKGYSAGNIQIVTKGNNCSKGCEETKEARVLKEEYKFETDDQKWCNRCKKLVDKSEFSTRSKADDRLQGYCKSCQSEYNKVYRLRRVWHKV